MTVITKILQRDKYLGEKYTPEQLAEAIDKWRADHPYLPPLHPSKLDPSREAECELCLDLEWLTTVTRDINGKEIITGYKPCTCSERQQKAAAARRTLEHSGIPQTSGRAYTFKTFKIVQGTEKAHEAALIMASGTAPFKILLLYGDVGNGKTHLLYATAALAIENGLRVKFIAFPDLLSKARMNIGNKDGGGIDAVLMEYKQCQFLCLDEVKFKLNKDGQAEDQWATDVLEDLLNYRYRHELYTMITTNHDVKAFPPQVYSRFTEPRICKCVLNSAPDYRKKVRK